MLASECYLCTPLISHSFLHNCVRCCSIRLFHYKMTWSAFTIIMQCTWFSLPWRKEARFAYELYFKERIKHLQRYAGSVPYSRVHNKYQYPQYMWKLATGFSWTSKEFALEVSFLECYFELVKHNLCISAPKLLFRQVFTSLHSLSTHYTYKSGIHNLLLISIRKNN